MCPADLPLSDKPPAEIGEMPRNAQQEPPFPDHETVAMSIRYPMMTCHLPTERCAIQEPHQSADCGEFSAPLAKALDRLNRATNRVAQWRYEGTGFPSLYVLQEEKRAARSAIEERFASLEQEVSRLRETALTEDEMSGIVRVLEAYALPEYPQFYALIKKLRRSIPSTTETAQ